MASQTALKGEIKVDTIFLPKPTVAFNAPAPASNAFSLFSLLSLWFSFWSISNSFLSCLLPNLRILIIPFTALVSTANPSDFFSVVSTEPGNKD